MLKKLLADLTLRIGANTAELSEGLKKASNAVNKYSKEAEKAGKQNKKAFGDMKAGISQISSGITEQLSKATGGLSDFAGGLLTAGKGVGNLTGSFKFLKIAIAGTGIGLLVIAMGSLVMYFTQTQTGIDLMNKAMNSIGAVVKVFIDRLGILGGALVKLFSGDFAGAAEDASRSVTGIGDAVKQNYDSAKKFSDDEAQWEKDKIAQIEKNAQIEYEISENLRKSKEREKYSEEERLQFVQNAQKLQKQLSEANIQLAYEELRINKEKDALGENINADNKKTAELAAAVIKLRKEENDKLRELIEQEREVKGQLTARQKEHQKIVDKRREELQLIKDKADLEGRAKGLIEVKKIKPEFTELKLPNVEVKPVVIKLRPDLDVKMLTENLQRMISAVLDAVNVIGMAFDSLNGLFSASMEKKNVELDNYYLREQERIENSYMTEEAKKEALEQLDEEVAENKKKLAKKQAKIDKANAIFGAVVSTAQAVASALTLPPPLSFAMAAITGAMGAAQIATIASTPLPAYANGTGSGGASGGLSLVGERGAELVNIPTGSTVTRANRTEQLLKESNNIHVTISSHISGEDLIQVVEKVERRNSNSF